jgi:type VI secretion system protein ImpE
LLCFAGEFERALKQLEVLAGLSREARLGALLYLGALHAEQTRQEMFAAGTYPTGNGPPPSPTGTLNGRPFQSLVDADPRIGARLEVFAAGQYLWIPMIHLASVRIPPPKQLRDLLWVPATVRTGPGFRGTELGEVLLPTLAPGTWEYPDDAVRLGRVTEWVSMNGQEVPLGQKLLVVDGEEVPILEVRELDIVPLAGAGN